MIIDEKGTVKYFNKFLWENTVLCLRSEDTSYFPLYRTRYAQIFDNLTNIVETRDAILKRAFETNIELDYGLRTPIEYLFMIDDDIKFAYRPNMDNKYFDQTPQIFEQMLNSLQMEYTLLLF